ncbi:MAG: hypothetical protein NVSMB26_13810 [Beijerinckiaceae bacterium]
MKKMNLNNVSVDGLVELFRNYALQQDEAMLYGDQVEVNRLFWKLRAVAEELKSRDGDQRAALLPLYDDKNSQVKVRAMKATLAVAPEQAIEGLSKLRANKRDPVCLDAGMCLWAIEEGIFKPT